MTLDEVSSNKWLMRCVSYSHCSKPGPLDERVNIHTPFSPSQIAHKGPIVIAEKLTENLRETGALDLATPDFSYVSVYLIR